LVSDVKCIAGRLKVGKLGLFCLLAQIFKTNVWLVDLGQSGNGNISKALYFYFALIGTTPGSVWKILKYGWKISFTLMVPLCN
jgi:hypothetical protein